MAKGGAVHGTFWEDPDVRRLTPDEKLIFLFLMTYFPNGLGMSGIYPLIVPEDIAHFTGLEREVCTNTIEGGRIKNVHYNKDLCVVFVKNRLAYRYGGSPKLIARAVISDLKITHRAVTFWKLWSESYPEFVAIDQELTSLIVDVTVKGVPPLRLTPQAKPDPEEELIEDTPGVPDELETEIDQHLARYRDELDKDDYTYVLTALEFIWTSRKDGHVIAATRRLEMLRRLAKDPTLKVARACFSMIDAGGCDPGSTKNWPYLRAILNGSATTWYADYMAEKDKQEGLELTKGV